MARVGFALGYGKFSNVRETARLMRAAEDHGFEMGFFSETIELMRDSVSALTAMGFDTDHVFLAVEISGSRMYFNAISSDGRVVDSGIIERRVPADGTQQPPGPGRRSPPSLDAP